MHGSKRTAKNNKRTAPVRAETVLKNSRPFENYEER